jgi:hypothetical protein
MRIEYYDGVEYDLDVPSELEDYRKARDSKIFYDHVDKMQEIEDNARAELDRMDRERRFGPSGDAFEID